MFYTCLLSFALACTTSAEFTFVLDAKDDMCFYERLKQGEQTRLEFRVIEGGNLDVDLMLKSPSEKILHKDHRKQHQTYEWITLEEGIYSWCFSNKFSTFTSKLVYFDFIAGDEPSQLPTAAGGDEPTQLPAGSGEPTQIAEMDAMDISVVEIHESLNALAAQQKRSRIYIKNLPRSVMIWNFTELLCMLAVMLCQLLTLRWLFSDKDNIRTSLLT